MFTLVGKIMYRIKREEIVTIRLMDMLLIFFKSILGLKKRVCVCHPDLKIC